MISEYSLIFGGDTLLPHPISRLVRVRFHRWTCGTQIRSALCQEKSNFLCSWRRNQRLPCESRATTPSVLANSNSSRYYRLTLSARFCWLQGCAHNWTTSCECSVSVKNTHWLRGFSRENGVMGGARIRKYSQCRLHRKARFMWLWYISRERARVREALSGHPVDHRGVERVVPTNSLPHHRNRTNSGPGRPGWVASGVDEGRGSIKLSEGENSLEPCAPRRMRARRIFSRRTAPPRLSRHLFSPGAISKLETPLAKATHRRHRSSAFSWGSRANFARWRKRAKIARNRGRADVQNNSTRST